MNVKDALYAWYKIDGIAIFSNPNGIKQHLLNYRISEFEAEQYRRVVSAKFFKYICSLYQAPNQINNVNFRNFVKTISRQTNIEMQTVEQILLTITAVVGYRIIPFSGALKNAGYVMRVRLARVIICLILLGIVTFFTNLDSHTIGSTFACLGVLAAAGFVAVLLFKPPKI
jgi:hypothetical protein